MRLSIAIASLSFGMLVWHTGSTMHAQNDSQKAAASRTPVVVELFTSEGCSTCPPADTLLAKLDSLQPFPPVVVIALEEHVDYWDQQGWQDPFDSPRWTDRQRDYSAKLHDSSPYTPEMVVDGTVGFVGSRVAMARDAILRAAAEQKTKIDLSEVSPADAKSVTLKVDIEKLTNATPKDKSEVILAITETGLHSEVKAGENAGHELHHSAVVRELKVLGDVGKNGQDSFSAQPTVKLDAKWNTANLRAVALVQEKKSRRILGATEIHITP